jgi:small subunit ribosomal protein S17
MENKEKKGKVLKGTLVSAKMNESAIVEVSRFVKHPKYGKYTKSKKRYMVHNPDDKHSVGEKVVIREVRPISKRKRFIIE